MPRLPIVSGRKVIKALVKAGFRESRCSGRHLTIKKKTEEKPFIVTVPLQREIAKGTLLSIIRQSGMTREEFLELLK